MRRSGFLNAIVAPGPRRGSESGGSHVTVRDYSRYNLGGNSAEGCGSGVSKGAGLAIGEGAGSSHCHGRGVVVVLHVVSSAPCYLTLERALRTDEGSCSFFGVKEGDARVTGGRVQAVHGVPSIHGVTARYAEGDVGEVCVGQGWVGDKGGFREC